ncbi:MAG: CesT family type III secretion system chaperone [Gemmatimonadota bacterium]
MVTRDDIEGFLRIAEMGFEEVGEGIWLVHPDPSETEEEGLAVVISHVPPVLVLRSEIRAVPGDPEARLHLYERLLELNATDLVHGAYGLENGEVVLSDTLELENLDFSEFRASLESLFLALTSNRQELATD